jgi:hypothetical protein
MMIVGENAPFYTVQRDRVRIMISYMHHSILRIRTVRNDPKIMLIGPGMTPSLPRGWVAPHLRAVTCTALLHWPSDNSRSKHRVMTALATERLPSPSTKS